MQLDLAAGHAKEATARIDAHLKTAQPTVELLVLAARVRGASGDMPGAETLLRKAIDTDTDRLQAYNMLGQIYARQGRLDDAKAQYLDVLKRDPKSISAGTMVAMVLEQQGKVPEAEKEYQRVLSVESNAAVAANNLAWLYVSSNRKLDEALQLAQTALQQLPDEPNIHDTLGWIYYRKNMAAAGDSRISSSSTRTSPFDPVFRYHLGMALVQTGDWSEGTSGTATGAYPPTDLRRRRGGQEGARDDRRLRGPSRLVGLSFEPRGCGCVNDGDSGLSWASGPQWLRRPPCHGPISLAIPTGKRFSGFRSSVLPSGPSTSSEMSPSTYRWATR